MIRARRHSLLVMCMALASCAHYGWADRAHDEAPDVHVATLGVRATAMLDAARLTEELADGLRREGIAAARWNQGGGDAVLVRCAVEDGTVEGFGSQLVADATVECTLEHHARLLPSPPAWPPLRARGQAGGDGGGRAGHARDTAGFVASHDALLELAVLDAIAQLTPQLAAWIRSHGSDQVQRR